MDFAGKVALVTGAGSGIGQACAVALAARGARVAVLDRNAEGSAATVARVRSRQGTAEAFCCDVTRADQVRAAIEELGRRWGPVSILVNNAAIQRYGTVTSIAEEDWRAVLSVILDGAFLVSRQVLPGMIEAGGGSIVMTGSVQSLTAQRNAAPYVTAKHGLLGLTRAMAVDYAPHKVRVNCILPGAIDTPLLHWAVEREPDPERVLEECRRLHLLGRLGLPEEVANLVVFLASDQASFITGAAIPVDGGLLVPTGGAAAQESGVGSPGNAPG